MPRGTKPSSADVPPPFDERVRQVVKAIPRGSVLGYGEVAIRAGRPGAARAVVRALHRLAKLPWWRVVRSDRTLAPQIAERQAELLRREGVCVEGRRVLVGARKPRARRGR